MVKVLFVCLGNICRSPMAEGILLHLIQEADLENEISVDSCGTGAYHVGERADHRMRATAQKHDIHLPSRARQLKAKDFKEFDYIVPMDSNNYRNVMSMKASQPQATASVFMMRYFDESNPDADVPDPYYGGPEGFDNVFEMLMRSNQDFLKFLVEQHELQAK